MLSGGERATEAEGARVEDPETINGRTFILAELPEAGEEEAVETGAEA